MTSRMQGSFAIFLQTLCFINYFVATTTTVAATTLVFTNETDREALLAIKSQALGDRILSSWNSSLHFCDWQGVKCGRRHQRVTALNLSSLGLAGSLSPHVGNLTFLRVIDLSTNSFHGPIPQETARLFRLQILRLMNDSFQGELPSNLSHCSDLRVIGLVGNRLIGKIPPELGFLTKLKALNLDLNYFTGIIPSSFGNLSALVSLSAMSNYLEGSIPVELGQLSNLQFFQFSSNKFSGMVPKRLYNISSIYYLSIADNQLQGRLPPDLGLTLPNLQNIYLGKNQFSGPIPTSIANASGLVQIDLGINALTGPVPKNLGILQNLQALNLCSNPLGDENTSDLSFLTSLTNCTNLGLLWFCQNDLRGVMPDSIANLSTNLFTFRLETNYISGSIPPGIGNLVSLEYLALFENMLTGTMPDSIGELFKLQEFFVYTNKISGEIPASIGNITRLSLLHLANNLLEGRIPVSLGNCIYLEGLELSHNQLNGVIPEKVVGLSSLSIGLSFASNNLTGPLPSQVGNLKNLNALDISDNKLSGKIPSALENCLMLEILNMGGNFFEGTIPSSFRILRGIQILDLSRNNLSGQIPEFLGELPLRTLNLSFNNFEGELPMQGVFGNISAFSVLGNHKLCGGIEPLQLPACPTEIPKKQGKRFSHKLIIIITSVVLFIILSLACLCAIIHRTRSSKGKPSLASPLDKQYPKLSYADLVHTTDGFSSANLIGEGRYGYVYKGILSNDEQTVAVKVLNLQQQGANKTFMAECEALRNIRHRNLVKITTSCSSIDFKGNDFKALVFEFMPNGSLESWLHPSSTEPEDSKSLNLVQRVNIAIDVASALDYLHNHCETPVVHCDLKPSNILLDDDLTAHVGDFGLTRFLSATTGKSIHAPSSSIGIRGTIGYVAPEYGMCEEVSRLGDVYSYGVVLMELFTSKRPTDSIFTDNFSLHNFVKVALPDRVMEIVDPLLTFEEEVESNRTGQSSRVNIGQIQECLVSILRLGVICSTDSLRERMHIKDVLIELHALRKMLLKYGGRDRVRNNP